MDISPGHIVIDLEPGADPIAGHVRAHGQPRRAFTGWTGLFAALRALTSDEGHVEAARGAAGESEAE